MATGTDSSYGSQLVEMQGSFKLSYPMLPELGCLLTELAENGCRGQILFKFVPDPVARSWKRCLGPNRPVRIRIEGHPVLGTLQLDCIVNRVQDTKDATNVELWFNQLTPGQASQMKQVAESAGVKPIQPVGAPQMPILVSGDPNEPPAPNAPPRPPANARPGIAIGKMPPPPPPPPPKLPTRPPSSNVAQPVQSAKPAASAPVAAPVAPKPVAVVAPKPPLAEPAAPPPQPVPAAPVAPASAFAKAPETPKTPPPPADPRESAPQPEPAAAKAIPEPAPEPSPEAMDDEASRMPTASLEITPPAPDVVREKPPESDKPSRPKGKLGDILVQMGKLTQEQVDEAVAEARARHEKIGRYMLRENLITPDVLCRALALQSGLPMTDLTDLELSQNLARLFPHTLMLRHCFIPFDENASFVCIGASNPIHGTTITELERIAQRKIEVFLAREDYILQHIGTLRGRQADVPRRHIRYDIALPVMYQFCTRLGSPVEVKQHEGFTLNISEGGMLVNGPKAQVGSVQDILRKGLCLSVVLAFNSPQEIRCICRVKSIREADAGWQIGMQLVDTTEDDRRRLKELCVKALMKNKM